MKKTYITKLPNHIGTFLEASRCFASLGINITRVSYNKAVDTHTLFIDVEGEENKLKEADKKLMTKGYLQESVKEPSISLVEFNLPDVPGSVIKVLEVIERFTFNISYISSQSTGSEYQVFKMGLLVEDQNKFDEFLEEAGKIAQVRVIDFNRSEKVYDNTIFYNSFVDSLLKAGGISEEGKDELLINTNLAMQMLDERGLSPYRTFDSISKFAEMLAGCRGEAFSPRITHHKITDNTTITTIEPPCGSNTIIIKSGDEYLFVDSGYSYYREEMTKLINELVPEFETMHKRIFVTHCDLDHCGLLNMFDEVILGMGTAECLAAEYNGDDGFREKLPLHRPYVRICKLLTQYEPVNPDKFNIMFGSNEHEGSVLGQVGVFNFGELSFEVYEGAGGHVEGELVMIDYDHNIAFTGDIYVNIKGMTSEQKRYNSYAPILMTSVDTDAKLATRERNAVLQRLGRGNWKIFGAHGAMKEYDVTMTDL
nr:Zn-dependent hydrolase [Clostridia bacterium]